MNKEKLKTLGNTTLEKYNPTRMTGAFDTVMPGYFGGDHVMFIAQNPGLLKAAVDGDQKYEKAYANRLYGPLQAYYLEALRSSRGTYGMFINDIYGEDWDNISITNVFKCPFADNVIPKDIPEIEQRLLTRQIEYVEPKVIVAVGTTARRALIKMPDDIKGRVMYCEHPSYSKRTGRYNVMVEEYSNELSILLKEHGIEKPVHGQK